MDVAWALATRKPSRAHRGLMGIARIDADAPPGGHFINARLGPAALLLPPPIPRAVDTAIANAPPHPPNVQAVDASKPRAAEPHPFVSPGETSILRQVAEYIDTAGHQLLAQSAAQTTMVDQLAKYAQDMERCGIHMIDLADELKKLAVVQ